MLVRQYKIGYRNSEGQMVTQTCWLDGGLKPGWTVTLKDDDDKNVWTVLERYETQMERQDLHKNWPQGPAERIKS